MPSFFVCLLFTGFWCGVFFSEEKRKYQEYRRKKNFPDNSAEQVNTMADIHSRKIKETLKEKVPFHIFILEEMTRVIKQ